MDELLQLIQLSVVKTQQLKNLKQQVKAWISNLSPYVGVYRDDARRTGRPAKTERDRGRVAHWRLPARKKEVLENWSLYTKTPRARRPKSTLHPAHGGNLGIENDR